MDIYLLLCIFAILFIYYYYFTSDMYEESKNEKAMLVSMHIKELEMIPCYGKFYTLNCLLDLILQIDNDYIFNLKNDNDYLTSVFIAGRTREEMESLAERDYEQVLERYLIDEVDKRRCELTLQLRQMARRQMDKSRDYCE